MPAHRWVYNMARPHVSHDRRLSCALSAVWVVVALCLRCLESERARSLGLHSCHPLPCLTTAECLTCLPLCLPSHCPPSQALQMPKVALLFLTRGDLFHHGVWERWFKAGGVGLCRCLGNECGRSWERWLQVGAMGWWAACRGGQAVQAAAGGSACISQESVFGSLLCHTA